MYFYCLLDWLWNWQHIYIYTHYAVANHNWLWHKIDVYERIELAVDKLFIEHCSVHHHSISVCFNFFFFLVFFPFSLDAFWVYFQWTADSIGQQFYLSTFFWEKKIRCTHRNDDLNWFWINIHLDTEKNCINEGNKIG